MSLVGLLPPERNFSGYPTSWEFDGLLTSGEPVHLRPMLQSDISGLAALAWAAEDLSRSFDAGSLTNDAPHGTEVIEGSQVAFVLLAGTDPVAFGGYHRSGPGGQSAEFVLVVADSFRPSGGGNAAPRSPLGPRAHKGGLAVRRRDEGREPSHARGSRGHRPALCEQRRSGVVRVEIDLRPTPDYRARCDEREATAEAASIAAIFATIGRSRRSRAAPGKVWVMRSSGPSSPGITQDASTRSTRRPGRSAACQRSPRSCRYPSGSTWRSSRYHHGRARRPRGGRRAGRTRHDRHQPAGFGETGRSGVQVEAELLATARRHGMRIVGPNCLGVVNTDPEIRMNATFAGLEPLPGSLALVSQSGAVGIVLVEQARTSGIGLSSFVSVGNSLDVSANDLLCYFERDERTAVVALYLESLGNPRKFARIARRSVQASPSWR